MKFVVEPNKQVQSKKAKKLRGCLVLLLFRKFLGFSLSFCKIKLNTMFFGKKVVIFYFGF
jgi:hypothetical protein